MAWEMKIPVLSTAHIPGDEALSEVLLTCFSATSEDGEAIFVYVGLEPEELIFTSKDFLSWFTPIINWCQTHAANGWVRFCSDGDIVDELPVFHQAWN